jgi:hypothetical protein
VAPREKNIKAWFDKKKNFLSIRKRKKTPKLIFQRNKPTAPQASTCCLAWPPASLTSPEKS